MAQFTRQVDVPVYSNYKKYKPYLRIDFRKLCAYCERPEKAIGGAGHCEIDHYKPQEIAPELTAVYDNLYYCCRECNGKKSQKWPSQAELDRGRRFSDPCREDFYQEHCVEASNGTLTVSTECGRYTRDAIFLDREELVDWRVERRQARQEVGIILQLRTELLTQRTGVTDARMVRKIDTRVKAIDGFVKRTRAIYGL